MVSRMARPNIYDVQVLERTRWKRGGKSTASTNERAADEKVESSAKRPKQALGKGGEKDIDNQSALEDEQGNFGDGEDSVTQNDKQEGSGAGDGGKKWKLTGE